jgi:hypothetical protein
MRRELHSCDDVMAVLGHADRGGFAKAGAGTGDEYRLRHWNSSLML